MQLAQAFWNVYREQAKDNLRVWGERSRQWNWSDKERTKQWTEMIKQTAEETCRHLQPHFGCDLDIGRERINRIDVFARDCLTGKLIFAFESELGRWETTKGWHVEFVKLRKICAKLRVIYAVFDKGQGRKFPGLLREWLETRRDYFENGPPGEFLLILGPEYNREDRDQPWLAYSIGSDMTLSQLSHDDPLFVCRYLYPHL